MRVMDVGELIPCASCSKTKGRRMATEYRSTRPLERRFVELSGNRPAGGALYLVIIVVDFSPMGWPYFLKQKSDVWISLAF